MLLASSVFFFFFLFFFVRPSLSNNCAALALYEKTHTHQKRHIFVLLVALSHASLSRKKDIHTDTHTLLFPFLLSSLYLLYTNYY